MTLKEIVKGPKARTLTRKALAAWMEEKMDQ